MNVAELINNLGIYASQSPENGHAEVVLKIPGSDACYTITGANDARGVGGVQHMLIFLPDESRQPIGVKAIKIQ